MTAQQPILPELLAFILFCLLLFCMVSCKCPCKSLVSGSNSTSDNDSVRTEYVHDSVYIDRYHTERIKGDTVFVHDSIDRWRNKYVYIHDSIDNSRIDTITQTIEVEKKGSAFLRGSGIALWVLIACLVIGVIIGIIIKIAK